MAITTYAATPTLGVDLNFKGSTVSSGHTVGTTVLGKDGFHYTLALATTAIGSTSNTVLVMSGGSATTVASAALANYACRTAGGVAAGQYFWAPTDVIRALT